MRPTRAAGSSISVHEHGSGGQGACQFCGGDPMGRIDDIRRSLPQRHFSLRTTAAMIITGIDLRQVDGGLASLERGGGTHPGRSGPSLNKAAARCVASRSLGGNWQRCAPWRCHVVVDRPPIDRAASNPSVWFFAPPLP